jgi:hypothetical protein
VHSLHPTQACYMGIEYAKYLNKSKHKEFLRIQRSSDFYRHTTPRYGKYKIHAQDRNGNLCVINQENTEEFIMEPSKIALSSGLIGEFDAYQAFYVGILCGLKISKSAKKPSYLRIVK